MEAAPVIGDTPVADEEGEEEAAEAEEEALAGEAAAEAVATVAAAASAGATGAALAAIAAAAASSSFFRANSCCFFCSCSSSSSLIFSWASLDAAKMSAAGGSRVAYPLGGRAGSPMNSACRALDHLTAVAGSLARSHRLPSCSCGLGTRPQAAEAAAAAPVLRATTTIRGSTADTLASE